MSRTKIVATIGPASCSPDMIGRLAEAGMSVARLNSSQSTLEWHADTIARIRRVAPGVPILLDVPGRKIRTAMLAHEPSFEAGDEVVLTSDRAHDGRQKVPIDWAELHLQAVPGSTIVAEDGTVRLEVIDVRGSDVVCRALVSGTMHSRKGVSVPNVRFGHVLTPRDREILSFARTHGVDFVGISFVESAAHVAEVREVIGAPWPAVVAKVENQGGLDRFREIVEAADAVMIDRGDLSVETGLETVAVHQKRIIQLAQSLGTPVIVATEMLSSMTTSAIPTQAEVSDITNAVLDGCAAMMLSGETAVGRWPVQAVEVMRRIATAAEAHLQTTLDGPGVDVHATVPRATGDAIALICRELPIVKIVAITRSGYAARMIAARRTRQPIIAVSNDPNAAMSFNLLPGTTGVFVDVPFAKTSTNHIEECLRLLWERGLLTDDDLILVTAVGYPRSGNRMNLIQTHYVRDLVDTLQWRAAVERAGRQGPERAVTP